jgi:hypothetical protein
MKKIAILVGFAALFSAPVFADSFQFKEIPVTGSPTGGYHVINIDGAVCKVKSSAMTGASAGCNYTFTNPGIEAGGAMLKGPWVVENRSTPACSTKCE